METKKDLAPYCQSLGLKHLTIHYREFIHKAQQNSSGYYEFLQQILLSETAAKRERTIQYRILQSKLPRPYKLLDDFDFDFQPSVKKNLIMDLATMNFIDNNESILFIGDCGTGKSHLAQALALIACQQTRRVYYTTCAGLITDLNTGVYEKSLAKRIHKYIAADLLIIDEMGHDRLELQVTKEAHLLFKVIDSRYRQNKSIIVTSNVAQEDWADFLRDQITTRAILDRIFHRSIKILIKGKSYRKHQGQELQQRYNTKLANNSQKQKGEDDHT